MSACPTPRQPALALEHAVSFAREDFLEGLANGPARARVRGGPEWPGRVVALVGPAGSGKSPLASIWAATAGARFLASRALADTDPPSALTTGALVLDDVCEEGLNE